MFGTVSKMRLKEGVTVEQLKEDMALGDDRPAGSVSLLVFQSVNDPQELWVATAFESRDAYFKNANSPEQNARFERMHALMDGQPEWHDGNVVVAVSEGRVLTPS
jgi:quinol monooxygenase YgiN